MILPISAVLIPSINELPPSPEELDALLRLLDDETPEVRSLVTARLSLCGGDISEWLSTHPRSLSAHESCILRDILRVNRREILESEWIVPSRGTNSLMEDWEWFESLLRSISDFLHDGITFRQPLSDALDLLAEEADADGVSSANELRIYLFDKGFFTGNEDHYDDPRNSDLAWCISEEKSNPLGLCVIFTLVARRLGLLVEPVNFPGHFLCRIYEDGYPIIIDCFDRGRLHLQCTLLESPDLSKSKKTALQQIADPRTILNRLLNNLIDALTQADLQLDAQLIRKIKATLV